MSGNYSWEIQVPGKWILAGEHSVLRGSRAVVFPLFSKFLKLRYLKTLTEFEIQIRGQSSSDIEMIIWSVFEKALGELGLKRTDLKGCLEIESHIKFGAGMGASATLAVGVTQFLSYLGYSISNLFLFAKKIEDLFHGESSGVDVAVALHQKAMIFQKSNPMEFIEFPKLPLLYLSYTGQRGVTKDCVSRVKNFINQDLIFAQQVDDDMKKVVEDFIEKKFELNFDQWVFNLEKAQTCFERWGLVPDAVNQHIQNLKRHGARACKLTGSGYGGYVLSLWTSPPQIENVELIPVSYNN